MPLFADLHTHSKRSDGFDSVCELIDNAARTKGLRAFALCDHDTLPPVSIETPAGEKDPVAYAAEKGILLLPAIEISCDTTVDDVHIIGLFCDMQSDGMKKLEKDMARSKTDGYKKLCELLPGRGINISWQSVIDYIGGGDNVQRKHIFETVAALGYAKSWQEAKLRIISDPSLNVRREKPHPKDAISLIHKAGGQAILAHPYLIGDTVTSLGKTMTRCEYIDALIDEYGLDGMEADYPYHKTSYKGTLSENEMAGRVYRKYGPRLKFLSGGSDYHAEHKKGIATVRSLGDGKVPFEYLKNMILPHSNITL